MQVDLAEVLYAGFWVRFFAFVLDSIIQMLILVPLLFAIDSREVFGNPTFSPSGSGFFAQFALPMLWAILFLKYKSATPGKIMMGVSVVDATTGATPSLGRLVLRYLGYYISVVPCLLGFLWIGWDKRKQGFHDMIANTVVIMNPGKPDLIEM